MGLPIVLELSGKQVVVIGGGKIAFRKATKLVAEGAYITVVSLDFVDGFNELENCTCIKEAYGSHFLQEAMMVIAATSDSDLNTKIYEDAKEFGVLCSTIDFVSPSDFSFMATESKRGLTVSVSTNGQSPAFSKSLVKRLSEKVTEEDYTRLVLMRQIRIKGLTISKTATAKATLLRECESMTVVELEQMLNTLNC